MLRHLPTFADLLRWLLRTAWAPVAVLVFHQMLRGTRFRDPLDFTVHALGGASMAYILYYGLECFRKLIGELTGFGRYLFSFALACVIGVWWEFLELASDIYRGTHIQRSVHETMGDLIADSSGALCALVLICLARWCSYFTKVKQPTIVCH